MSKHRAHHEEMRSQIVSSSRSNARLDYWRQRYHRLRDKRYMKASKDPVEKLAERELAYIAGIVDGEGSITIIANAGRSCYEPGVQIAMTHRKVIEWLALRLHVKCKIFKRASLPNRKTQYTVRVLGRRAAWLCTELIPFLIVKRKQADLVAQFGLTYGVKRDNFFVPERTQKFRASLKNRMHELNSPNGYKGRKNFVHINFIRPLTQQIPMPPKEMV